MSRIVGYDGNVYNASIRDTENIPANEDEALLRKQRHDAMMAAKSLRIAIEEFEKEGFDKSLAIEMIKIGIGGK